MGIVVLVIVFVILMTAIEFFTPNRDNHYDQRSSYEFWRDRWRKRSLTRARSRRGLLTSTSSVRRNRIMDLLMNPKLFPTIMIVLSVLAAVSCLLAKDYRRVAYYCASATLLTSVTY